MSYATHPSEMAGLTSDQLRERFVLDGCSCPVRSRWALTHHDRILIGGALPEVGTLELTAPARDCAPSRSAIGARSASSAWLDPATSPPTARRSTLEAEDIVYVGQGPVASPSADDAVFY